MEYLSADRCVPVSPIGYLLDALGVGDGYGAVSVENLASAVVYVPSHGAIVAQTCAMAPLLSAGVEASARRYAADVVLLRIEADADGTTPVTADIALAAPPCAAWVENDLTLWSDGASVWLVPEAFGPSVAVSADGFTVSLLPPYETLAEHNAGVGPASRAIAGRRQLVEA